MRGQRRPLGRVWEHDSPILSCWRPSYPSYSTHSTFSCMHPGYSRAALPHCQVPNKQSILCCMCLCTLFFVASICGLRLTDVTGRQVYYIIKIPNQFRNRHEHMKIWDGLGQPSAYQCLLQDSLGWFQALQDNLSAPEVIWAALGCPENFGYGWLQGNFNLGTPKCLGYSGSLCVLGHPRTP